MVSVCLPSDALSQHLPSYLGFAYLGHRVSLHGCSSKSQPLLLTLDKGYLLTTTPPDLQPLVKWTKSFCRIFLVWRLYLKLCVCVNCSVVSKSLLPHELKPTSFLCPWNSPGKNSGVGSHSLFQGIFLIQGSNPGILHCGQFLYCLEPPGKPQSLYIGMLLSFQ